jgi:hypothetical protein
MPRRVKDDPDLKPGDPRIRPGCDQESCQICYGSRATRPRRPDAVRVVSDAARCPPRRGRVRTRQERPRIVPYKENSEGSPLGS